MTLLPVSLPPEPLERDWGAQPHAENSRFKICFKS